MVALEGVESVHIGNSGLGGGVEQSFASSVGGEYQVSFWAINWGAGFGDGTGTVRVYNAGGDDLDEVWTHTYTDINTWTESVFNFVASDTTSTLEILNTPGEALTIDVVSVVDLSPWEISHSEGQTLVWEEGATTDSFTVELGQAPTAEVTLTLDPMTDDISLNAEAPNDAITLTFGTDDWNVPQTVTVKANNDNLIEGLELILIAVTGASDDSAFVAANNTSATVVDDDAAGIQVIESGGSTDVVEGGAADTYAIVLTVAPSANVDISVNVTSESQEDPNQVNVDAGGGPGDAASLTFTHANWETPQMVTVTALDDDLIENHPHADPATIRHAVNSADEDYNGLLVPNVSANVGENDCDFGGLAGTSQSFSDTDFDLNCLTDINDLAIFVSNYLQCAIFICP